MEFSSGLGSFINSNAFDYTMIAAAMLAAFIFMLVRSKLVQLKFRLVLVAALLPLIILNIMRFTH
jgi:hypothetical protein